MIMKKVSLFLLTAILLTGSFSSSAQDSTAVGSKWTVGADFYNNYIWRGTKFGTGPAFQPSVKFNTGGLTIGVWGSFDASGYSEVDPFISYAFSNGLSIGITDYYYPGLGGAFTADSSNAYELNAGFTKGGLSLRNAISFAGNSFGGARISTTTAFTALFGIPSNFAVKGS